MIQEQKLLPRMAVSYWDIKFQMQRQADKIKKDYPRFQIFKSKNKTNSNPNDTRRNLKNRGQEA